MIIRPTLSTLLVALACLIGLPSVAAASSCAEPTDPTTADVSFVGLALATEGGDTLFEVLTRSRGSAVAPQVWVRTGREEAGLDRLLPGRNVSTTDVSVEPGARYAVGASVRNGELSTTICQSFRIGAINQPPDELRALPPVPGGLPGQAPPLSAWWVVGPALAALVGAMLAFAVFTARGGGGAGSKHS